MIKKDIKIVGKEGKEFLSQIPIDLSFLPLFYTVSLIPPNRDSNHDQNGLSLHNIVMILIITVVLVISGILLLSRRYCAKWHRHGMGDYGNKKYGAKDAHEEFSEVRFLTGDDELDFTLATEK
jgi:hypothetical protein